jgi:hypothetical protein
VWHWIIKKRVKAHAAANQPIHSEHVAQARVVLFTVFARYGDSMIAFKAINEFIALHPNKRYLLITRHQTLPYAEALIHHPIERYGVNKRHDWLLMWRITRMLRREPPDLGFNPWSHQGESEYFVSFCRRFSWFRLFARYERNYNLYRRPREYLMLPAPAATPPRALPDRAKRIVLVPFSTDVRKALDRHDLELVIDSLRRRFQIERIVVAGMKHELKGSKGLPVEPFVLGKSRRASQRFIDLLRSAELFVGVDSGPLHLADALGISTIGIFGPTAPETVLDRTNTVVALRHADMAGTFCDVLTCRNPVCLHRLCATLDAIDAIKPDFDSTPAIERQRCVMPGGNT